MEKTIFNHKDILFTIDGIEVQFEREVTGGYLVRKISNIYDEDGEVIDYNISKDITFHETLYKNPPRDKLNKTIKELNSIIEHNRLIQKEEIDNHKANLAGIKKEIEDIKHAYPEIIKHEILKQVIMFLNKDYKYVLYIKNMELCDSKNSSYYLNTNFYINSINSSEHYIYIKRNNNEDKDWQYDSPVLLFKDLESAITKIKLVFLNKIHSISNRESGKWYSKASERIKDMKNLFDYSKFNSYNYIRSDEKLMKLYNDKMAEYEKLYEAEKQQAIDAELAELQKKQEELLKKK